MTPVFNGDLFIQIDIFDKIFTKIRSVVLSEVARDNQINRQTDRNKVKESGQTPCKTKSLADIINHITTWVRVPAFHRRGSYKLMKTVCVLTNCFNL